MPLGALELSAWQAAQQRDAALRSEPARRRAHGIVHTPPELARAVVLLADELLTTRFGLPRGICAGRVQLIDPACGPGAFLAAALALAEERGADDAWRLLGFDLDAAALARCRALLSRPAQGKLALVHADVLGDEMVLHRHVTEDRVRVILGNPPWTSARAQPTAAAQRLLEDFRCDERGVRLPERKLGVLSDAYVRFFRVCAELARSSPAGAVLGLISNASFLDGPVHRGMRAALWRWFDELLVIDLGGSALVQRSGARDDNVFGVRPAVAITLLCRYPRQESASHKPAHYARIAGARPSKLALLCEARRAALPLCELRPAPPFWRFTPSASPGTRPEYAASISLSECMPFHREGVQSNRDAFVFDADPARLLERLHAFARGAAGALLTASHHFDPAVARRQLAAALEQDPDGALGLSLRRIGYRPWDERYYCPITPLCHRPRPDLQRAVERSEWSLVSVRKDRGQTPWTHAAASQLIIDNCLLSARSSCRARAFPTRTPSGEPNLLPALGVAWSERLGVSVDAPTFAAYALGLLCSSAYRAAYDAQLHEDYPRILPPPTAATLRALATHGVRLRELFCAAIEPESLGVEPPRGARFAELELDAGRGELRWHGEVLFALPLATIALRVGHHAALAGYLAARKREPLDARALGTLRGVALRLGELCGELVRLDESVGAGLPSLTSD